jgi:hypothetical protein
MNPMSLYLNLALSRTGMNRNCSTAIQKYRSFLYCLYITLFLCLYSEFLLCNSVCLCMYTCVLCQKNTVPVHLYCLSSNIVLTLCNEAEAFINV